MIPQLERNNFKKTFFAVHSLLSQKRGNILIYIVMVMVIFAVLGAAMVSLFSTSISSSATANESRRAFYVAEAGLRYGLSELRKENGFSSLNIATLNDTLYKMPPSGDFDITVFGAWFKSSTYQGDISKGILMEVEKGKIPSGFFDNNLTPVIADLYIVNVGFDLTSSDATAKVTGFSDTSDTSFKAIVSDDFKVYEKTTLAPNIGTICLAVKPFENSSFTPSGDLGASLDLKRTAKNIFPKTDGCFLLKGIPYFYKTAKDDGTRFTLYNISIKAGTPSSVSVDKTTDYIILAPNNYFITSKGSSGTVTYGGDLDNAVALYDHSSRLPADLQVTLPDMQQIETDPNYISDGVDAREKYYMKAGGISGSNFGAMWFKETINYGGSTDYCTTGKCLFKNGIRAFFTLEYSGSGDGLIFALINGSGTGSKENDIFSIGGDFDSSELLGYAGDSRLVSDPDPSESVGNPDYLDKTSPRGLRPPKFGLEFDTKVNFDGSFESEPLPKNYCYRDADRNIDRLKNNTRNDPNFGKHTIQYVFWGDSDLNIDCRGGNAPSYDDNRHEINFQYTNPKNYKDRMITSGSTNNKIVAIEDGAEQPSAEVAGIELQFVDDWLKGASDPKKRQWAVRLEITKLPSTPTYTLHTWVRQCSDLDCTNIVGTTFFDDTRINYPVDLRPPQLQQTIALTSDGDNNDAAAFQRFIFGFTSATDSGDSQSITIREFQLSFWRPNDPTPDNSSAAFLP